MKRLFFSLACLFFLCSLPQAQTRTQHEAFRVSVQGSGQPLYLIPGASCSGDVFEATLARYSQQYTCHVFTLAGYAGVAALPESDEYLGRHKAALQNYIKTHGRGIVVGHSLGGYLAMWIAADAPESIEKLIIVDALPYLRGSVDPNTPEGDAKAGAEQYLSMMNAIDSATFATYQLQTIQGMIKDSTHWPTVLRWGLASDKRTLAYTLNEMMHQDLRKAIARIQAPTLVLGQYDGPFPQYPQMTLESIRTNLEKQYAAVPVLTIEVKEGARHFIMYDAPDWYYAQIDTFLSEVN